MSEAQVLLKQASPTMTFDEAYFLTTATIKGTDPEYSLSYLTSIKAGNSDNLCSTRRLETYSAAVKGGLAQSCHPGRPQQKAHYLEGRSFF